jgi:hypothetical protein
VLHGGPYTGASVPASCPSCNRLLVSHNNTRPGVRVVVEVMVAAVDGGVCGQARI